MAPNPRTRPCRLDMSRTFLLEAVVHVLQLKLRAIVGWSQRWQVCVEVGYEWLSVDTRASPEDPTKFNSNRPRRQHNATNTALERRTRISRND
eukprot:9635216-Alexandrium_andersonii.AAC.1